jgi:hypothetical protein
VATAYFQQLTFKHYEREQTMLPEIEIDKTVADKLREWVADGRGFTIWRNEEIGGSQPQYQFTPASDKTGERYGKPNWRYTEHTDPCRLVEVQNSEPIETFRGRLKRYWFGTHLTEAIEAKAKRIAEKHQATFVWQYSGQGDGCAIIEIVRQVKIPFDLPGRPTQQLAETSNQVN